MSDQTPDSRRSAAAAAELQQLLLATDNVDEFLQQLSQDSAGDGSGTASAAAKP